MDIAEITAPAKTLHCSLTEYDDEPDAYPTAHLPKLAYISDVPIEKSVAGMLLIHHLFSRYPPERLLVLETLTSQSHLRLPGVTYQSTFQMVFRLTRTRVRTTAFALIWALSGLLSTILARRVRNAGLQGVVTVSHGIGWLVASKVAIKLNLPLHIINHDDWKESVPLPSCLMPRLERQFTFIYGARGLRFCVSPYMEEYYRDLYGAAAEVLYPGRSFGNDKPREHRSRHEVECSLTIGYAGSLDRPGFIGILQQAAESLLEIGGSLTVFSPMPPEIIRNRGLVAANVCFGGQLPNENVVTRLRESCDALILPMSSRMGINARISFPSKLAEYTATGLPIIIVAPPDSSAARWARDNQVGIVLEETDTAVLKHEIRRLATDSLLRESMGRELSLLGRRCFSYEATAGKFLRALAESRTGAASIRAA